MTVQLPLIKLRHFSFLVILTCNIMSLLHRAVPLFTISNCLLLVSAIKNVKTNPDIYLGTPQLIEKYGYPMETHKISTEDGYLLEIHRIPYGRTNRETNSLSERPAILMQHGLGGSSADWVLLGPERSLAYLLADAGYDVWLGNNRGNVYSRNHISKSPESANFWNFSYHELGVYDLPAMIDYIVNETKHGQIFYIGHSQGTTIFWVMASEKPSYNSKVALMIGLAPVAFTGHIRGPVTKLAKLTYAGVWIGETLRYPELHTRSDWQRFISNMLCNNTTSQFLCSNMILFLAGITQTELTSDDLNIIINHVPSGGSWKQLVHYGQGYVRPDRFLQFDYYNKQKNIQMYNSTIPPAYNLKNVIAPVALFSSNNDLLATPKDVNLLKKQLSNVVVHNEMSTKDFNHFDFIWGKHSVEIIFESILELLTIYK